MANREALRELQGRLAQRLQTARTDPRGASWLAFECAGQGLLTPLHTAGEIFALGTLAPLPHTQPWFLGVANLRGLLHGVVDLAAFLGLRSAAAPALEVGRAATKEPGRLLAFNPSLGTHCAVLIDRLAGLRGAHQLTAVAPPAGQRPGFALGLWADADGRQWQELDLAALARHPQFLAIDRPTEAAAKASTSGSTVFPPAFA
jgi:twitching motility protein PilI